MRYYLSQQTLSLNLPHCIVHLETVLWFLLCSIAAIFQGALGEVPLQRDNKLFGLNIPRHVAEW